MMLKTVSKCHPIPKPTVQNSNSFEIRMTKQLVDRVGGQLAFV